MTFSSYLNGKVLLQMNLNGQLNSWAQAIGILRRSILVKNMCTKYFKISFALVSFDIIKTAHVFRVSPSIMYDTL